MKKSILLYFLLHSFFLVAQTDYSDTWEDFYSYNNVKDIVKVDQTIYALADNAVFIYDSNSKEVEKLSSVHGLSGETTTAIYYNKSLERLVIGYENGLIEVVDADKEINVAADIVNFNQSGSKRINHIEAFGTKLYLSTPFAIVVYDLEKLEYGDTYFIGANSTSIEINETTIIDETIYAATENGIYSASLSEPNLVDAANWEITSAGTTFNSITNFNNQLYAASNSTLYKIDGPSNSLIRNFSSTILSLKKSATHLTVALNSESFILDTSLTQIGNASSNTTFDFTLNTSYFENNTLYLGTKEYGILLANDLNSLEFEEIHPEGPLSNDVFSITVQNKHLWVVYGGYDATYTPIFKKQGFSHYNGEEWINVPYDPE